MEFLIRWFGEISPSGVVAISIDQMLTTVAILFGVVVIIVRPILEWRTRRKYLREKGYL